MAINPFFFVSLESEFKNAQRGFTNMRNGTLAHSGGRAEACAWAHSCKAPVGQKLARGHTRAQRRSGRSLRVGTLAHRGGGNTCAQRRSRMTSARVHFLRMEAFQARARLHICTLSSDKSVLDNSANRQSRIVILTMLGISICLYT